MKVSIRQSRVMLAASAVIALVVAVILTTGVIPLVQTSNAPDISPESAVPAFWVSAGLHVLAALVLVLTAMSARGRSRVTTSVLTITGITLLVLAFALGDATAAFRAVGASMDAVSTRLSVTVAADFVAGVATLAVSRLLPPRERN